MNNEYFLHTATGCAILTPKDGDLVQKERLTLQNIQSDLKSERKRGYAGIAAFAVSLLIFLGFFLGVPKSEDINRYIFLKSVSGFLVAVLVFGLVFQIVDIVKRHTVLKNRECIVTDKLVGMEIKDHVRRGGTYQTYHLYFASYGEYLIPFENYEWSTLYPLSRSGMYRYCSCGDEFYLVLSKPHTGKILLAYNTKLFDLEN